MGNIYEAPCWEKSGFRHPGGIKGIKKLAAWEQQYRENRKGCFLNLCCGDGSGMEHFGEYGDMRYGFDCSHRLLETARERFPECHFICGDAARGLPFADGWAGAVLCECSLSQFGSGRAKLMEEIHRILRPDGLLLLADITSGEEKAETGFRCLEWEAHPEWMKKFVADWLWEQGSLPPVCLQPDSSCRAADEVERDSSLPGYFLGVYRRCE